MRYLRVLLPSLALTLGAIFLHGCPPGGNFADQLAIGLIIASNPPDNTQSGVVSSFSHDLTDGTGHTWDLRSDGAVDDGENAGAGTDDAFDGFVELEIDGTDFPTQLDADLQDAREVVYGPEMMSGLEVTRKVFVSASAGVARWLEVLENPTNTAITANVTVTGNLGSDEDNNLVMDSMDGNASLDPSDQWWTNCQDTGDPCVGHFFCEAESTKSDDDIMTDYGAVTVPANDRVILVNYVLLRSDMSNPGTALSDLSSELMTLEAMPNVDPAYLEGMTMEELNDVLGCGGNVSVEGPPNSTQPNALVTVTNNANSETRNVMADSMGAWRVGIPGQSGDTVQVTTSQGQSATLTVP